MTRYIVVFKQAAEGQVRANTTAHIESLGGTVLNQLDIINGITVEIADSAISTLEADES
ncbi:hypothetical protein AYI70_g5770, partial [Smittium culicis]